MSAPRPQPVRPANRIVRCFHCYTPLETPPDAVALLCQRCGKTIDLANYQIASVHSRGIRTHGEVVIEMRGRYNGPKLTAGRLMVFGMLESPYECDELVLGRHGLIAGVGAQRLLTVQSGTRVRLNQRVKTEDAAIGGHVELTELFATGHVWVAKDARLFGSVTAASFSVEEGGQFEGEIRIAPPSESSADVPAAQRPAAPRAETR